jgi:hypothetical protein
MSELNGMTVEQFITRSKGDTVEWKDEEMEAIMIMMSKCDERAESVITDDIMQAVTNFLSNVKVLPTSHEELGNLMYSAIRVAAGAMAKGQPDESEA